MGGGGWEYLRWRSYGKTVLTTKEDRDTVHVIVFNNSGMLQNLLQFADTLHT